MLMHVAIVCSFHLTQILHHVNSQFVYSVADRHLYNFQVGALMSGAGMNIRKFFF